MRPGLNVSCLACVIDSRHNKFSDVMVGGFEAPLHNGPVWSSIVPCYQVSLTDPHISDLLQAYIQFSSFDMSNLSNIVQLHTTLILRFVSTTMPPLNSKLLTRAHSESVVVGPGNVTPISLGFTILT